MALNLWECEHPGCDVKAVGTGGAIGLRAIGWWFERHKRILCPVHRPDGSLKRDPSLEGSGAACDADGPCPQCKGDEEADRLQYLVAQYLELPDRETFYKKRANRWDDAKEKGT